VLPAASTVLLQLVVLPPSLLLLASPPLLPQLLPHQSQLLLLRQALLPPPQPLLRDLPVLQRRQPVDQHTVCACHAQLPLLHPQQLLVLLPQLSAALLLQT
jgi:hypothetical protein